MEDRVRVQSDHFTLLPTEVILHVLEYLPLYDRKNVRRTCRLLNQCASNTRKEKFVFFGNIPRAGNIDSIPYISEILLRTNCAPLNLEFRGLWSHEDTKSMPAECNEYRRYQIYARRSRRRVNNSWRTYGKPNDGLSINVWKTCGDRVHSLTFIDCLLKVRTVEHMLVYCTNLKVLDLQTCSFENELDLKDILDLLIKLNIRHTQLRTLKLSRRRDPRVLQKEISTVFPHLEHLDTDSLSYRLKSSSMQLVRFCTPEDAPFSSLSPTLPFRLTEFTARVRDFLPIDDAEQRSVFRFFTDQNELEVVSLALAELEDGTAGGVSEWRIFNKELVFHVLRKLPKLRKFSFSSTHSVHWTTQSEISEFFGLVSRLKSLKFNCLPSMEGLSLPLWLFSDLALQEFEVGNTITSSQELLLHILQHSPKMESLRLGGAPPRAAIMQIFKTMPDLRQLALTGSLPRIGKFNCDDVECSLGSLQKLERLELWVSSYQQPFVREIIDDLQKARFPKMKYLKFCKLGWGGFKLDDCRKILSNLPTLESVDFGGLSLLSSKETIDLFQNSKNLRHVVVNYIGILVSCDWKPLFEACPALQYVSDERGGIRSRWEELCVYTSQQSSCTEPEV